MKVEFVTSGGERVSANAEPGDNLLRVAQAAGLPLEGTCEGQMACSTCHVIVAEDWFDRLEEASEEEEDMLDLAAGVRAPAACPVRSISRPNSTASKSAFRPRATTCGGSSHAKPHRIAAAGPSL